MTVAESAEYLGLADEEVPAGWRFARLGDDLVEDVQPGFACGINTREVSGVPHLRPMNVSRDGLIELADLKFVPATEVDRDQRWLRRGDVLFNNTNSAELVGKTAVYDDPEPRAFSNHMTRVRCRAEALDPRFCAKALHYLWQTGYFESVCSHHVSQASVGRAVLLDTAIPLPPVSEQQRIVAKVEELLAHVNSAREHLARVPVVLKRFRQSVLAAACSGRLTEDWRERGVPPGISGLLPVDEAPKLWRDETLPGTWQWAPLGEIADCRLGKMLDQARNQGHATKYLRNINVRWFEFDLGDLRELRLPEAERAKYSIRDGDVLVCEGGEPGRAAVWRGGQTDVVFQKALHRVRLPADASPDWLVYCLKYDAEALHLEDLFTGSTIAHLTGKKLAEYPFFLPPRVEQDEIVRRIEALFALSDAIEQRVAAATARADRLSQSILAKAFRGELALTDAELARRH